MSVRALLALACVAVCGAPDAANDTMAAGAVAGVAAWRAARLLQHWREQQGFVDDGTWSEHQWRRAPAECSGKPPPAGCINGYLWDGLREEASRNATAVCARLAARGITTILIIGDSFMRHTHVATLSFLSSNTQNASLANVYGAAAPGTGYDRQCEYEGQYQQADCRDQITPEGVVCGAAVKVRHLWWYRFEWPQLGVWLEEADLVIWSDGSHGLDARSYPPTCDPTQGAGGWAERFAGVCSSWSASLRDKVVWVSRHARVNPRYYKLQCGRESPAHWRALDRRFERALEERCGVRRRVDMHEITTKALFQVPRIHTFSYDGVHFGSVVNWAKAAWLWSEILGR
ncbi:hypothetical protein T484DRAFT_1924078 [Baffinella frigidus]|nr:hypothetical protein T484DRAFT_1924078 [Cryptophyta sp. CCMP2293]